MDCFDKNGNKVKVLSDPSEIALELNNEAIRQRFSVTSQYYLLSENNEKSVISNVPKEIFKKLKIKKHILPKHIDKNAERLVRYLLEYINLLQGTILDGPTDFPDGKEFQLYRCHHNSSSVFKLILHLKELGNIPSEVSSKIVLGYISRKVPFGSQLGNLGIQNDSIWMQDWHIWNYVQGLLFDMTVFTHGNILPPDGEIISWGTAEDHIFISPPKNMEYCGCAFDDLNSFNETVGQIIGFQ